MNTIELKHLAGGELQEKFNKSFEKVVENLQDKNTSFKPNRTITIKMIFHQDESRENVRASVEISEKLAPQSGMETSFYIGKDLRTGELFAQEYGKQVSGQMSMDEYAKQDVQVIGGELVDTETGEILKEESKVIDLRKAAL